MTDRATLLDLAARCEAATGPDRELDAEIVWRITPGIIGIERGPLSHPDGPGWLFVWEPARAWSDSWRFVPSFTASLDAALTLMPEGYAWTVYGGERPEKSATAYCVPNAAWSPWPKWVDDVLAATPALAICAAALRARAEEGR